MTRATTLRRFGRLLPCLLSCACVEAPSRAALSSDAEAELGPVVLGVGNRSAREPTRLDDSERFAIDDSCIDGPAVVEEPARTTSILVYDWISTRDLADWCVTDLREPLASSLECDPRRDRVTDFSGTVRDLAVAPGPVRILAQPPETQRDEVRSTLFYQHVPADFWGRGYPGVPTLGPQALRVSDLILDRPPSPSDAAGVMIRLTDCSRYRIFGAQAELVGRGEPAIYGDGGLLPSAEQPWTHHDGAIRFDPILLDAPTWATVRVTGRRSAESEPVDLACFEIPLRPRTLTWVFAQLGAIDNSSCGGSR